MTSPASDSTGGEQPSDRPVDAERDAEALRESTERYRALFFDNPHATFSVGLDGHFLDANQVTQEGESTWFEGLQLLLVYLVIALAFGYA